MATKKNLKWETKNEQQPKKYGTRLTKTDYDIPSFSYKSAFLMVGIFIVVLMIIPALISGMGAALRWPVVIFGGLICGFSVAYLQFVREKKAQIDKNFWIVGFLLSLFIGLLIYLVYFYEIVL